jgi:hypothetical protein
LQATYTTLDDPNGFATSAFGINNNGQIVGDYSNNGYHGFTEFSSLRGRLESGAFKTNVAFLKFLYI